MPDQDCPVYQPDHRSVSHQPQQRRSWFSRHFRRDTSTGTRVSSSPVARPVRKLSSRRSLSELAAQFMHPKRDGFKDENLQTLVRLCGQSKLYLPSDYAPASLVLPTCLRATAQFLVQHGGLLPAIRSWLPTLSLTVLTGTNTRGIFHIPGSTKTIQRIYDYYCPASQDEADKIDGTVSSPNLPPHLEASVHDVAGTFKRFLAGLPGGILGSLSLFDALVAIHSQLIPEPEFTRTKQSKLRARLLALAIGTLKSQYRRELICAVFGLLCLIGRTAERAPREDEQGRPLPTSDLMGYRALGQVFGSLLVGDLLDLYSMRLAHPDSGLILLPLSPTRRKVRRKSKASEEGFPTDLEVDKISVANDIAEMLITHWRDVVKHIKNLEGLRRQNETHMYMANQARNPTKSLRPSASAPFDRGHPSAEWLETRARSVNTNLTGSPMPRKRSLSSQKPPMFLGELKHVLSQTSEHGTSQSTDKYHPPLFVKRKRPSTSQPIPNKKCGGNASNTTLSPPAEESPVTGAVSQPVSDQRRSGSGPAEGETTHKSEVRGSAAGVREDPTDGHHVIHSPVPLSSMQHSPILNIIGRDQDLDEKSLPKVEIAADMAMTEPRRSLPSPVNLNGMRRHRGRGSHRDQHIGYHGRHSGQATRVSGRGSDVSTVSLSESLQKPELQSQSSEGLRSVEDLTKPPTIPQGLDKESLGSQGPGNSNPASLPSHAQPAEISVNQRTGRSISDKSLDSGYFPAPEQVLLFSQQNRPNNEAQTNPEPETPTIIGAFPEPDLFSRNPSKGNTSRIDSIFGSQGSREAGNQALQRTGSVVSLENRPPNEGHDREVRPIQGLSLLSEHEQAPGTRLSRHTSWLQRLSSGNPAKGRQPLDATSTPAAKGVAALEDVTGRATLDTTNATEGKSQTSQGKASSLGPLSGVKAMAAMFENVWNNPASLTSQLMGPRKSRSMGNTNVQFTSAETPPGRPMAGRSSSAVSKRVSELQRHLSTVSGAEDAQRGGSLTRDSPTDAPAAQPSRRFNRASSVSLSETPVPQTLHQVTHPSMSLPQEVQQSQQLRMLTPGRMTPGIEHPPIARHISQRRPPRSVTQSSRGSSPTRAGRDSPASMPLPGGTAALHAQVRHLQRQLAAKTEENTQLRHQIEALEGGNGIGTLSERLRNAERDAKMWRERALTAETRVAVFEKFLGRVRQLREREKEKGKKMYGGSGEEVEKVLDRLESAVASQGGDGQVSSSSKDSTDTEDGEVFRGRLKMRLGDMDGEREELEEDVYDEDEEAMILDALAKEHEGHGDTLGLHLVAAAREVLEYEDMRRWLNGTC